jgi:hypothetical protein
MNKVEVKDVAEILPGLLLAVLLAVIVLLILRRRSSDSSDQPAPEHGSDLIVDMGRKRLYVAMKHYFLEEKQAEDDWRGFEYLDALPQGVKQSRPELEKKIAARFRISPAVAAEMLTRILAAVQEVKKR